MKEYKDYAKITAHFDLAIEEAVRFGGVVRKNVILLFETIKKGLDAIPAADVVEVVRCKDCKYCIPATADGAEYELCIVDDDVFPVSVQKQHFCSRGKRKEE